jgi:DNA-binding NarL/FixJ family response regulator
VKSSIRVAIADRHENFRLACRRVLELEPDIEIVSESRTGFGLSPLLDLMQVDVLLFDEKIWKTEGQETVRSIREQFPTLKILYMMSSEDWIGSLGAMQQGVNGVIEKGRNTAAYLPKAIRKIVDGELWISRGLASVLMEVGTQTTNHLGLIGSQWQESQS